MPTELKTASYYVHANGDHLTLLWSTNDACAVVSEHKGLLAYSVCNFPNQDGRDYRACQFVTALGYVRCTDNSSHATAFPDLPNVGTWDLRQEWSWTDASGEPTGEIWQLVSSNFDCAYQLVDDRFWYGERNIVWTVLSDIALAEAFMTVLGFRMQA